MSDNQSVTSSMEESMVPPHGAMKGDELVDQLKKDFKDLTASRDERALLLKQRHEVALQIDQIDGFIHNEASPDKGKAADCLTTFTDTIAALDFYIHQWKLEQEARKREGKKRQRTFWDKNSQVKALTNLFASYTTELANLEEHLRTTTEEYVRGKTLGLASQERESPSARATSPLQERRNIASRRMSGLIRVMSHEAESLSKARRARLPFEAGSYRRAAFYFVCFVQFHFDSPQSAMVQVAYC
ncbi:hypothetical protein JCM5353_000697 [Sporobolomyces roseus]